MKKLSNTEDELKKGVAYKKKRVADIVVTRFPVYTKSYHSNENIEHCRKTSKIKNK